MDFVHLHNHSDYSVLDGAITVDKLISKTVQMGLPGIALTDHGNLFGAIEFYQSAKKHGIKPIIGQEFYLARNSRFDRDSKGKGKESSYHLILLAKNEAGYQNLMKLSSISYLEGFYYKPRIDYEVLEKYSKGIICSSACIKGEIPDLILKGKIEEAYNTAGRLNELFGKDNFYLEIQDHGIPAQREANSEIIRMSKTLNIPLIATNDCHYPAQNDAYSHDILLCIQTGKTKDDKSRMRFSSDQFYLKTPDEMKALFPDNPEALLNTIKILEMIDLELSLGEVILPRFNVPEGFSLDSYLKHLVYEGAMERYKNSVPQTVKDRIESELAVIARMQYSGYFLIVWDFIQHARKLNIPVGPGRGSAAGSMVSYCLGITDLDPIKYNLLFERFLNPDRNEMPDIDIDFCANRREEVIDYVKQKYGEDHVSQIITFNRMTAKAVLKDVARVMDVPFAEANEISKLIPNLTTLNETLNTVKEFKNIYTEKEQWKQLIDTALTLEGLCRSVGKHAAGVVISGGPVTEHVPLYRDASDGSISSQFEKKTLETVGLVKMDFLGLKNLTIIDRCINLIKEHKGESIDISQIPLDDEKTYDLLQNAKTKGVFQLEGTGMQEMLRRLGPTCFEDIIAAVALYRPGPLNSGMADDFITRKRDPSKIRYLHPMFEPILKDTLGVIVYQEQVMLISQVMGGFSLPEADKLRKAMGKKDPKIMEKMGQSFISGAIEKGIKKKLAADIYNMMSEFAHYAFNKSHSAAYALVAYQTAYLKANYPIEFMTALLSAQPDRQDDVTQYIMDCRALGISVLPPDINYSSYDFTIEDNCIRFGLGAVKGLGEKFVESMIQIRSSNNGFQELKDFLENIDLQTLNKGVMESLVKTGAFESIYKNRARLFYSIDRLIETAKRLQQDKASGQGNLFNINDDSSETQGTTIDIPDITDWSEKERLTHEKQVMGIYISGHPLKKYEHEISRLSCITISELSEQKTAGEVSIIGVINEINNKISKNGKPFAVCNIEDMGGAIKALFFPYVFSQYEDILGSSDPVMVKGNVEFEEDNLKEIIVKEIKPIDVLIKESISAVHIRLNRDKLDDVILKNIKSIIVKNNINGSNCSVHFHLLGENGSEKRIKAHHAFNITPSDKVLDELSLIRGVDSVCYSY